MGGGGVGQQYNEVNMFKCSTASDILVTSGEMIKTNIPIVVFVLNAENGFET